MKYCPACGNQVADNATFCSTCGTRLTAESAPQQNNYTPSNNGYGAPNQYGYSNPNQTGYGTQNQPGYGTQNPNQTYYGGQNPPPMYYNEPAQPASTVNSSLDVLIKILLVVGLIIMSFCCFFINLIWQLPMTIIAWNKLNRREPVSIGLSVCILLFCNTIAGVLLLCRNR